MELDSMNVEGLLGKTVSKIFNKAVQKKTNVNPGINIKKFILLGDKDSKDYKIDLSLTISREGLEKILDEVI